MGPEFQKCNITTFVTTEGQRQQRRNERHEEESEGVEKGNEKRTERLPAVVVEKTRILVSVFATCCSQCHMHSFSTEPWEIS